MFKESVLLCSKQRLTLVDVSQAIAFVEDHKDDTLWEELITRSLKSPAFLSELLEHVRLLSALSRVYACLT